MTSELSAAIGGQILAQQAATGAFVASLFVLLLMVVFCILGITLLTTLVFNRKSRVFGLFLGLVVAGGLFLIMFSVVALQRARVATREAPADTAVLQATPIQESESVTGEETAGGGAEDQASANEPVPDWVRAPARRIDNIWHESVSSGTFASDSECVQDTEPKLTEAFRKYMRKQQVQHVSWVGAGIFGLLGLAYSLLRIDSWTEGHYSKRIFIGVPLALLGLGAAVVLLNFS